VVRDPDGELIEETIDWYAQDLDGNVWYFGEISKSYEDGELDNLDGSWKSDKDEAKPGIIMEAAPEEGDFYREEYFLGDAEDVAEVIDTDVDGVGVPLGVYNDVLNTKNSSPIEPDVYELKYHALGIGTILEVGYDVDDMPTGERVELVSTTNIP